MVDNLASFGLVTAHNHNMGAIQCEIFGDCATENAGASGYHRNITPDIK